MREKEFIETRGLRFLGCAWSVEEASLGLWLWGESWSRIGSTEESCFCSLSLMGALRGMQARHGVAGVTTGCCGMAGCWRMLLGVMNVGHCEGPPEGRGCGGRTPGGTGLGDELAILSAGWVGAFESQTSRNCCSSYGNTRVSLI